MKKRISNLLLVLFFITAQLGFGVNIRVKAASGDVSVKVVVESYNKILAEGTSVKSNALEALRDLTTSSGLRLNDNNGTWVTEIGGVENGKPGKDFGWQFAVNRNGQYLDTGSNALGDMTLANGDKLILYFGDWHNIQMLNKLDFSTEKAGENLSIAMSSNNWGSITPISGLNKVVIDGKEYSVSGNVIQVPEGLSYGKHVLQVSDFKNNASPNVVADDNIVFDFGISSYFRIEGLSGTIAEGTSYGTNVYDMVADLLDKNNVRFTHIGKYIDSINGLKAGKFGDMSGWLCYSKRGTTVDSLPGGMGDTVPQNGDQYVVYYGNWGETPFLNLVKFEPGIVKENQAFKMQFIWAHTPYGSNVQVESKISNTIVTIDNTNYITDANAQITVNGLALGEHTYKISGYNMDDLPTVVMDKGILTIDNVHSPIFESSPQNYNEKDNSKVVKDINGEVNYIENFLKANSDDPWASLTLQKLGLKAGETYLKDSASSILDGELQYFSNTDLEKLIINLTALGYSPYNFAGEDLVSELLNRKEGSLLVNDAAFALLTYCYANIEGNYNLTEDKLIQVILAKKLSYKEGEKSYSGWALSGSKINPDITGIVLNALAPYNNDKHPEVKLAISEAVNSLSEIQVESGYLTDSFGIFSESQSFAIIGLIAVGENPEGVKFTKAKGDLVSALVSFKGNNGQYKHDISGSNNYMATEEALRAFYSLSQYKAGGKYNFYESNIDAKKLPVYSYSASIKSNDKLPATGAIVDNDVITATGLFLLAAGSVLMVLGKKKTIK